MTMCPIAFAPGARRRKAPGVATALLMEIVARNFVASSIQKPVYASATSGPRVLGLHPKSVPVD
jgi:hypothetical protein